MSRSRIPRGAACPEACYALLRGRAARDVPPQAARQRSRWSRCHAACFRPGPRLGAPAPRRPRKARRRALLQTPRPAGRRAWQGRRWAAPVDARHAGPAFALLRRGKRVPALPASAWPLPPVGPPERRAEAGCPGRRSRDDGGSRRPVRSARLIVFVFGGAREPYTASGEAA